MSTINKLDLDIIDQLIKGGYISQEISEEIKEKMEIGLTLGEVLIADNYISNENLALVLVNFYKNKRISVHEINTKFIITNLTFFKAVAQQMKLEYVDLDNYDIDYKLTEKFKASVLGKLGAIPLKRDQVNIYVVFVDPFDMVAKDNLQRSFNQFILKQVIADPLQVKRYISDLELQKNVKNMVATIKDELAGATGGGEEGSSGILSLIDLIIKTAVEKKTSDIHIEATETNCVVRCRIDGMLAEVFVFEKEIFPALASRMKLLSNLDISERRKPQDGRFSMTINDKPFDFRVSTLPIIDGESIVSRILDKSKVVLSLEGLGMHPETFKRFTDALKAPYGIILVTGPTGSGKTTTLYGALNEVKAPDTKIITVEDPVEYQLDLIQQVYVNEKVGLSFAAALRSILRQDPDIIMVGEIRDQETLRIAIQAALTGHLVLSTLHTNDALSAVSRILDMGIESYLISGAVVAIEAQRLIRRLCPHCKQPTLIDGEALEAIRKYLPAKYQFYKPMGCDKCSNTGYAGREMISEVLTISDKISRMIASNASKEEMTKVAYEEGFIDMFHDGIIRAARGSTSVEEVYRVAKE